MNNPVGRNWGWMQNACMCQCESSPLYEWSLSLRLVINGAVTLDSGSVNTDGTLTLSKNNSTMEGGQSSGVYNGALGGTTISYVVELAANDTVGLDYYFSGSATYRNTAYAGYFSGYLLG